MSFQQDKCRYPLLPRWSRVANPLSGKVAKTSEKSLLAKATGFFALYGLYIFVAGHSFFDNYYGNYGIDSRWLDLGFAEVTVKGFSVLFLRGGFFLWPIYIFVIITPITFEVSSRFNKPMLQATIMGILLLLVPTTYWVAADAGREVALQNKGDHSALHYVTFSTKAGRFGGRLLLYRTGLLFVDGLALTVPPGPPDTINLHIYRMDEITDLEVTEIPR
jgi:hypothetical protein